MSLVTVKKKYQIVIPAPVRRKIGIKVGDLLEATAERGKISFVPKSAVDREVAESLEDFKRGRTYGPFKSADEMIATLHDYVKKARARKGHRKKSKRSRA